MINVLYLSVHEGLEYDEVRLLSKLDGVNVRSCGAYVDPTVGCTLRPAIAWLKKPSDEFIAASYRFNTEDHKLNSVLLDWADVVIYMHAPEWIHKSLDILDCYPSLPIVYRSIGQSSPSVEAMLGNYRRHFGSRFHIVRYSPNEKYLSGYVKSPWMIRFAKDPDEFHGWTVKNLRTPYRVMLATQNGLGRGNFTHTREAIIALGDVPKYLVGPSNEEAKELLDVYVPDAVQWPVWLRDAPVLFYTGTVPASYTLTPIEAMMTGVPIVSISGELWAEEHRSWCPPALLEIPELIGAPFVVDSWDQAKDTVESVLASTDLMAEMSHTNRLRALELFGHDKIAGQWASLLGSL